MSKPELEGINDKQQMVELIRQNFTHPSILFWGIQNQIQISGERPELRKLVNELNELTKKEDPTRLTTMANVMFVEDEDDYNYVTDTIGYNKYFGWYNGEAGDFAGWLDGFHKKNPTVKLAISEYGAEGILQYHSSEPKIKDYSEEYHALYHETVWKIFEKRPFLWATYVFCKTFLHNIAKKKYTPLRLKFFSDYFGLDRAFLSRKLSPVKLKMCA